MYGFTESSENIAAQLSSPEAEQDVFQTRALLRKALQTTDQLGSGDRAIIPHIVKLLASSDIVVKKLAAWFLLRSTDHNDVLLLAVNTLLKDCADPNPMIRGLALRTLSSFPTSELAQYAVSPILTGLKDSSAYVRRTAVLGCAKLGDLSPDLLAGQGVVDTLYTMIRDPDPLVVVNCLNTLDELLKSEGGIVVNRNMSRYLLNQLEKFTDWGLVTVFQKLRKYAPSNEDEILDIMNVADKYLRHQNCSVMLSCIGYFTLLVKDLPHLYREIIRRAKPQMLQGLSSGNAELSHELLVIIESYLESEPDHHGATFLESYRSFFCKYNEPVTVKLKKIAILPRLVTQENISELLEELSLYCSDLNELLSKHAIGAVGRIASEHPRLQGICIERLMDLLQMEIDYVTAGVLQVLKCLDLRLETDRLPAILNLLPSCLLTVTSAEGRGAIWCLLGEFGDTYDDTPYMLEEAITDVGQETSAEVRLELLNASMKIFFRRPAEMQAALGQLLEVLVGCGDLDVQDRARWYYNLLQTDVQLAEDLVLGR